MHTERLYGQKKFNDFKSKNKFSDLRKKQHHNNTNLLECKICSYKCSFKSKFYEAFDEEFKNLENSHLEPMPETQQQKLEFLYHKLNVYVQIKNALNKNSTINEHQNCWNILQCYITRVLYLVNMHRETHVKSCFKYAKKTDDDPNCRYRNPKYPTDKRTFSFFVENLRRIESLRINQLQRLSFIYLSESNYALAIFHPSNHNFN